jgi:hypothetical protein
LDTGQELERECEFGMALKYYFAGRMFFARLRQHLKHQPAPKRILEMAPTLGKKFQDLYEGLLPMTNAQASNNNNWHSQHPPIIHIGKRYTFYRI